MAPYHPINQPAVPGGEFIPLNDPTSGTILSKEDFPENEKPPVVFTPIKIRSVEIKNRIWFSPSCMYSCPSGTGLATSWHLVHQGSVARGGAGVVITEATGVTPEGRITPECVGLWNDEQLEALKPVVEFVKSQGSIPAIQLAHAGRKANTYAPWLAARVAKPNAPTPSEANVPKESNGFPGEAVAPSAIAWNSSHQPPKALDAAGLQRLRDAYTSATKRALKAGYEIVEVHGAHGYLLDSFVSPRSNQRTDEYGGSFENRIRFPLEVAKIVRDIWPQDKPVFYRLSATHWSGDEKDAQGNYKSWGIEQTVEFSKRLKAIGIDLVDVSSAGNDEDQKINAGPGYQTQFAKQIKDNVPGLLVAGLGLLTDGKQIESDLQKGEYDVANASRAWLRDPHFALTIASEIHSPVSVPVQYEFAYRRLLRSNKQQEI